MNFLIKSILVLFSFQMVVSASAEEISPGSIDDQYGNSVFCPNPQHTEINRMISEYGELIAITTLRTDAFRLKFKNGPRLVFIQPGAGCILTFK